MTPPRPLSRHACARAPFLPGAGEQLPAGLSGPSAPPPALYYSRHGGGSRRAICPLGWRALVLLAGAATMAAGAAQAQDNGCAPRTEIVAMLAERYGEQPQSVAIDATGRLIEMLANPDTGSWSALATVPGGQTCLILSGQGFHVPLAQPQGSPA